MSGEVKTACDDAARRAGASRDSAVLLFLEVHAGRIKTPERLEERARELAAKDFLMPVKLRMPL